MIVKMQWDNGYERMVECDTVHKLLRKNDFELSFYKDGKLVENPQFKDSVQVFFMEHGKTIDRIDFKIGRGNE